MNVYGHQTNHGYKNCGVECVTNIVQETGHHRIARQWHPMMTSKASLIYQLVSFDTATGYVGQVAYRELTYERFGENGGTPERHTRL